MFGLVVFNGTHNQQVRTLQVCGIVVCACASCTCALVQCITLLRNHIIYRYMRLKSALLSIVRRMGSRDAFMSMSMLSVSCMASLRIFIKCIKLPFDKLDM